MRAPAAAAANEGLWIEERLDQRELVGVVIDRRQIIVEAIDRIGQHRVAEPVDGVRKFRQDRWVKGGRRREHKWSDRRLNYVREFLENQMLVLHLGHEACGLEQA